MKSFRLILCLILSVLILLSCAGCTTNGNQSKETIWSLHGTWITKTQVSQNVISLSITGSIPADIKPDGTFQVVDLSVYFPDDFPYGGASDHPMSLSGYPAENDSTSVIYWFCGSSRSHKTGLPVPMLIYFSPQKEYGIIVFGDAPDSYLVVYSDLNADIAEILAYFDSFIQISDSSTLIP